MKEATSYAQVGDQDQFRMHTHRTAAASNLYGKCHDIKVARRFLGHTQSEMTSKYIKDLDMDEELGRVMLDENLNATAPERKKCSAVFRRTLSEKKNPPANVENSQCHDAGVKR